MTESPQDRIDKLHSDIRLKPLNYEVATIAANIQSKLDLDRPDLVEPAPQAAHLHYIL
jgi:hypothetical protein